jgi:hypothetical protein
VKAEVSTPTRIARLPLDRHGRPIPWFVHREEDGTPDFRVIRRGGLADAVRFELCWVCGQPRGRWAAFVIGPMCAINRVSAEPPSHRECAIFSARACPFLTTPGMRRRERGLPEDHADAAGNAIKRNPGVALVWSSRSWSVFRAPGGVLFDVGDPTEALWYCQSRAASRNEVLASIDSGLPLLLTEANKEGEEAVKELVRQHDRALQLVPDEVGRS